jgi:HipA-like protein
VRTVIARRAIRKMRGCSQSQLIEAEDGRAYVVKFANNPQFGARALINEHLAAILFRSVGVTTPEHTFVSITHDFLSRYPAVLPAANEENSHGGLQGLHFGSLYPGDPERIAVFDFLPDTLLPMVYNRDDFFGALVLDKWLGNADGRQTIFYRANVADERTPQWIVSMIDHGCAFSGDAWKFIESEVQGIYARRAVYGNSPALYDFAPWIDRVLALDKHVIEGAVAQIPSAWLSGNRAALESVCRRLWERRSRLEDLVEQSVRWLRARSGRAPDGRERQCFPVVNGGRTLPLRIPLCGPGRRGDVMTGAL